MSILKVIGALYLGITDPCNIKSLNIWAPIWFMATLTGGWWYGFTTLSPTLLEDFPHYWTTFTQIFAHVVIAESITNWLCVRYVDCSYSPSLHGDQNGIPAPSGETTKIETPEIGATNNNDVKSVPKKTSYMMYVLSGMKESGSPMRTAYPYWSWVPCIICNHYRPPRCHHCSLCRNCILKRDHHCFFVGSCIGYRNMRHFIVFCFWTSAGTVAFLLFSGFYYYYILYEQTTFWDLLPVIVHVRWYLTYTTGDATMFITLVWSIIFFTPLAIHFFYVNMDMVFQGQTSFERDHNIVILDDRSVKHKLQSVFGRYWYLNFIVPLHWTFPALEDPVYWPNVHV